MKQLMPLLTCEFSMNSIDLIGENKNEHSEILVMMYSVDLFNKPIILHGNLYDIKLNIYYITFVLSIIYTN